MLLPVKAFATCLAAGSLDMLPGLGLSHTSQQLQSHANACTRNLEAMLAHQCSCCGMLLQAHLCIVCNFSKRGQNVQHSLACTLSRRLVAQSWLEAVVNG